MTPKNYGRKRENRACVIVARIRVPDPGGDALGYYYTAGVKHISPPRKPHPYPRQSLTSVSLMKTRNCGYFKYFTYRVNNCRTVPNKKKKNTFFYSLKKKKAI